MAREAARRSFRYSPRSREDVMARTKSTGFDSYIKREFKTFKPKDGKNLIRILPPTWPDARHYGYDLWINYNVGVDNGSYLSLSKMKNERDPLMEARREAEREGDKKLADDLVAKQRILMWVIDRNAEDEGPLLWAAPITVDKALANLSFDEDTKEVLYIDDPEGGNDVRFYKEGQGKTTKYDPSKMKLLKSSPISEDSKTMDEWLEFVQGNPLPNCLQFYDYEHINGVFNGQIGGQDDEAPVSSPIRDEMRARKDKVTKSMAEEMDDEIPDDPSPQKRASLRPVESANEPEEGLSIRDRLRRRRQQLETNDDDE